MSTEGWDVYRGENGEPVTLTAEQFRAVWHAIGIWKSVHMAEVGKPPVFSEANVFKSRLLGRMLRDGRSPLAEKPPHWVGAPGYHLVEPELQHYYLGAGPLPVRVGRSPSGELVVEEVLLGPEDGGAVAAKLPEKDAGV